MERLEIMRMLVEEPKKLVDENTEIEFLDGSRAVLLDGWAAGGSWYKFRFSSGLLEGKTVWLIDDGYVAGARLTYIAEAKDDGFVFNSSEPGDAAPGDGDCIPDINGAAFWLDVEEKKAADEEVAVACLDKVQVYCTYESGTERYPHDDNDDVAAELLHKFQRSFWKRGRRDDRVR